MTVIHFTHRFVRLATAAATVALVTATAVSAQQSATYEIVSSFDGIFVNGQSPSGLIQASDGNFYGTTATGGLLGGGTIFKIDAAGVLTTVHNFPERDGNFFRSDGALPRDGVIQASDGNFYGTTNAGGACNCGTVFRLDSAGRLTTLHAFSFDDGSQPSLLVEASDGALIGVTFGVSTVFRVDPQGAFTTLHRFEKDFGTTTSALLRAADGSIYGATTTGGPLDEGTIFRLDANGTLTTLHNFSDSEGLWPLDLIQGSDGDFYGVTSERVNPYQEGTIFKIDATGILTTLYRFPRGTSYARALIQGTDGSFYGIAGSRIFKFDPGGTPTTLYTALFSTLIQSSDGTLYGTGGVGGSSGGVGIFKFDLAGTFTPLYNFVRNPGPANPVAHVTEGSDGRLYGTTAFGGQSDVGTVFAIEPSGAASILHSFIGESIGITRLAPRSGLLQATDGKFYGARKVRSDGGTGGGEIFAIDSTGAIQTIHSFVTFPPGGPGSPSGLIQATDGRLYGTTSTTVFRLPLSGPLTTLTTISAHSDAALIEASDGTFYGTTHSLFGGRGQDTIFSVNAAGSAMTRHTFSGPDGSLPRARLLEGLDGSLYGTTSEGGAFDYGTVFRFEPAGTLTTLHHFAGVDGANPYAGLLLASDGRLYGTTRNGGAFDFGTIYRIDATGTLTTLHNFAPSDGAYPEADLIQASDGNLYGTTAIGGPGGGGVVFRVRLGTSPPPTDGYFEIVSRNSDKCLDVYGASTDAAAQVIQWTCHGGLNQQWRLESAGGGSFRIIARHSGQALDVYGALLDDVAPIIQWPVHGGDNQAWTLEPASDGYVRIVVRHSGKAMDVEFASTDDGARVIQYTPHDGANQQWLLRPVE
jgi:uncharacterized repeat protein (TIGR03803 family)